MLRDYHWCQIISQVVSATPWEKYHYYLYKVIFLIKLWVLIHAQLGDPLEFLFNPYYYYFKVYSSSC